MRETGWKRRIFVHGFQYRLIVGNFLYLFAVVLTFLVVWFGPAAAVLADESVSVGQREAAAQQLLTLSERVWFAIPVLMALCLFHSALVSHRVAGPLFRFKRIFADLAAGDLSMRIQVRRRDYLHNEAEAMNEMVQRLAGRLRQIESSYGEASATLPQLMQAVAGNEEAAVMAGKLGTQLDSLGAHIRQFQITDSVAETTSQPQSAPTGEAATPA